MLNKKIFILVFIFLLSSVVRGQYYEFTGNSNNGFQQGCAETYDVYFNTEGVSGITVGQPLVILDNTKIEYATGGNLKTNLFNLYTSNPSGFTDWVSQSYPQWAIEYTKIYFSAKNESNSAVGGYHKYGSLIFQPKYDYDEVSFVFDYNGGNQKTSLAKDGNNMINPTSQNSRLTGTINVDRKPCLNDTISPVIVDNNYINLGTRISNNGLDIDLKDSIGNGTTPYVYTGGGLWTGNTWGVNNQHGIDSGTVSVTVSGNGQTRTLNQIDFNWTPSNKTWQNKDRDYNIKLPSSSLFDFGIEKLISISYSIRDRVGNLKTNSILFNSPKDPWISNISPLNNQKHIDLNSLVEFKISDDWAGVDSGSIVVTLSGIDNSFLGHYSGIDLLFSEVLGIADYPDYNISLNHLDFPTSGTINVSIYGLDLAGNGGILFNFVFSTRPDCSDLGCCKVILQTGSESTQFSYLNSQIYVSGGNNPFLYHNNGLTGYINCNMQNQGMNIYKGIGQNNTGVFVGLHDSLTLIVNGNNVKAVLSGNTLVLTKISYSGGGGGGSSYLEKDYCPDGDFSLSYYDGECGEYHGSADICGVNDSNYSLELKGAYLYSYVYGITTKCPIEDANLNGYLYRNHFAKMISEFAVNVLGKKPEIGKKGCDKYNDIKDDSDELKGFMKTACELNLMGMRADGKTPKDNFDPHLFVTRAEFGTVFSRLLFGDKYNIADESLVYKNEGYWYKDHLNALKENGIMTKIDGNFPKELELRGRVMLMMQRADSYGVFAGKIPALNGIKALFK